MIVVSWSGVVSAVCVTGVEHMVDVIGCCSNVMAVSLMTRYNFVFAWFLMSSVYRVGNDLSVKDIPNALAIWLICFKQFVSMNGLLIVHVIPVFDM